jgi:hypothetical protein
LGCWRAEGCHSDSLKVRLAVLVERCVPVDRCGSGSDGLETLAERAGARGRVNPIGANPGCRGSATEALRGGGAPSDSFAMRKLSPEDLTDDTPSGGGMVFSLQTDMGRQHRKASIHFN